MSQKDEESQGRQDAIPGIVAHSFYCRRCREWSQETKCPKCGERTVPFGIGGMPPGTLAGVWDPEDGHVHIVNWDDIRFIIDTVSQIREDVEKIMDKLGLTLEEGVEQGKES